MHWFIFKFLVSCSYLPKIPRYMCSLPFELLHHLFFSHFAKQLERSLIWEALFLELRHFLKAINIPFHFWIRFIWFFISKTNDFTFEIDMPCFIPSFFFYAFLSLDFIIWDFFPQHYNFVSFILIVL